MPKSSHGLVVLASRLASVLASVLVLAGCSSGNGFSISGKVRTTGSLSPGKLPAAAPDAQVTHVMAVSPSSQDAARVVAEVGADGTFDLQVDPSRPWVIVFIDASQVGDAMVLGVYKADVLDALPPAKDGGKVDLGNVTIVDGKATGDISYASLLAALGIDAGAADDIGALDDLCLRYVNPDIDGDGVLDVDQNGHNFGLDFHTHFSLRAGDHDATVADVVGDYLPDDTAITYGGAGIYVSFPAAFGSGGAAGVRFDDPVTVSTFGPGGGTTAFAAGTVLSGATLIENNFGDMRSFGVYAAAGHDLPQGVYHFIVGGTTLTFSHVRTHTDAELAAATHFIMPFIRFVPRDAGCVSGCTIAAIDYTWRKREASGWVTASPADLALVVGDQGGYISIRRQFDDGSEQAGFVIPKDEASGSIPWAASSANLADLDAAGLAAMTTDDVCHLGLSYDDKLGMRFFGGIGNAAGTCAH